MERLNKKLALFITKITGTMWTAYLFCALSLISLPAAIESHNAFIIVSWVSQSFLQLVLLPVIMVGQSVGQEHHETSHAKLDEIITHLKKH